MDPAAAAGEVREEKKKKQVGWVGGGEGKEGDQVQPEHTFLFIYDSITWDWLPDRC